IAPPLPSDSLPTRRSSDLDRDACFALLRRERPVAWFEEFDVPGLEAMKGPGYWVVTRYADVMQVSRQPEVFISGKGVNVVDTPRSEEHTSELQSLRHLVCR